MSNLLNYIYPLPPPIPFPMLCIQFMVVTESIWFWVQKLCFFLLDFGFFFFFLQGHMMKAVPNCCWNAVGNFPKGFFLLILRDKIWQQTICFNWWMLVGLYSCFGVYFFDVLLTVKYNTLFLCNASLIIIIKKIIKKKKKNCLEFSGLIFLAN